MRNFDRKKAPSSELSSFKKTTRSILWAAGFLALLSPEVASAKLFRNSYVSFELPPRWDCSLIDTEWVCKNTDTTNNKNKEAIIILTAKEVGPADSLPAYEAHLKTPRQLASAQGTPIQSRIFQVVQRQINNHPWVDGMHLNSEVRDYYTRYLATVKERIAVLVTFSAHKAHYTKYTNDFFKAIQSLRVTNPRYLMNQANMNGAGANERFGAGLNGAIPTDFGTDLPEEGSGGSGSRSTAMNIILALAVLLGAGGIYMLMRKSKKGGRRKP